MPNRGEVWLADPDPKRGTEPGKTRPVLIDGAEPLRIRVHAAGRLRRTSDLLIDQLRAIDNRRLAQGPMTTLSAALMTRVHEAIAEVLDFDQDRT